MLEMIVSGVVATAFLDVWQRILRDKDATTLFSRLKRFLSMLLQLALILLLVIALGDPRAKTALLKGRTLVVLLDTSASMQARDQAAFNYGVLLLQNNRAKEAVPALQRYRMLQPDDVSGKKALSQAFRAAGMVDSAQVLEKELIDGITFPEKK